MIEVKDDGAGQPYLMAPDNCVHAQGPKKAADGKLRCPDCGAEAEIVQLGVITEDEPKPESWWRRSLVRAGIRRAFGMTADRHELEKLLRSVVKQLGFFAEDAKVKQLQINRLGESLNNVAADLIEARELLGWLTHNDPNLRRMALQFKSIRDRREKRNAAQKAQILDSQGEPADANRPRIVGADDPGLMPQAAETIDFQAAVTDEVRNGQREP